MGPIHKFSISIWVRNFDFYDEIVVFHDEIWVLFRKSWLLGPIFGTMGFVYPFIVVHWTLSSFGLSYFCFTFHWFWSKYEYKYCHFSLFLYVLNILTDWFSHFVLFLSELNSFWPIINQKNLILHPHISISNQILNNFDLCSKLATMKNCFIKCLEAYNQHFFKGLHAVGQRIAIWDRKETISKGRLHSAEKFLESPWGHKTYKNESRCVSSNSRIQVFLTHPKWATT